ncbi:dockerin type I repeat-containing protein [Ruminococcus sp.]|jgi:hypothetical protein|uniref:dockerin type I repeat-containing protein n=1 Tax=Ruminococcus sp. TaxID=41978 RepID=UPI0026247708|nr:dockerin type I repeat-containing protein [Ruminococcus sp.]MCI2112106.1 dockerin type I repeat-containing protein [Ruminococcus sp.]MDD6988156.1 dockerin type I repeat-containing protein [Ruminococcus sp.]MDY6201598.1 dockerin type I repeat-containing protein [Ruminococcus sp.]
MKRLFFKRAVSVLVSFVLLTSTMCFSAFAVGIDEYDYFKKYTTGEGTVVYQDINTNYKYTYIGTGENSDGTRFDVLCWYGIICDVECLNVFGDYILYSPGITGGDEEGIYFIATEDGVSIINDAYANNVVEMDKFYKVMKSNDKTFSRISLFGDADSDGILSVKDATEIQKYIAGIESDRKFVFEYKTVIDINGDGFVDITDATALNKMLVEG